MGIEIHTDLSNSKSAALGKLCLVERIIIHSLKHVSFWVVAGGWSKMVSFKMAPMGKTKTSTPFSQIKEMWFFTVLLKTYKSCKSCKCLSSYPIFILCFKNSDTKKKRISQFWFGQIILVSSSQKKKISVCNRGFSPQFSPQKNFPEP